MKKTINVNESSIIDLKAELFRNEEKFRQSKTAQDIDKHHTKGSKTLDKLAALTGKKKSAAKRKADDALPNNTTKALCDEDAVEYEKAKLKLQAKARLYDKMSRGEVEDPEDDDESFYLVDFHKKVYSKEAQDPDVENADDKWVEFEDSLGRQRRCMKKDLETFKALDPEFRPKERTPSPPTISSEDVRREMMRKKWEAEQEELSQNLERDVHYQNVLFDEVRGHGVAYYQFSKDEEERKSQMETLTKLREQTIEQRTKREQIKAKRQAALNARLAKVKEKKLKAKGVDSKESNINGDTTTKLMGGDPTVQFEDSPVSTRVDDSQEENEACSREPIAISTQVESSTVSKAESNIIESNPSSRPSQTSGSQWKKTNYALEVSFDGPSLKRKDAKSSYAQWIQASREERNGEFAPPTFYYDKTPQKSKKVDRENPLF